MFITLPGPYKVHLEIWYCRSHASGVLVCQERTASGETMHVRGLGEQSIPWQTVGVEHFLWPSSEVIAPLSAANTLIIAAVFYTRTEALKVFCVKRLKCQPSSSTGYLRRTQRNSFCSRGSRGALLILRSERESSSIHSHLGHTLRMLRFCPCVFHLTIALDS